MELRQTFAEEDDVVILYVMADNQINDKTLRFIDGLGLRDRVRFASDPGSLDQRNAARQLFIDLKRRVRSFHSR